MNVLIKQKERIVECKEAKELQAKFCLRITIKKVCIKSINIFHYKAVTHFIHMTEFDNALMTLIGIIWRLWDREEAEITEKFIMNSEVTFFFIFMIWVLIGTKNDFLKRFGKELFTYYVTQKGERGGGSKFCYASYFFFLILWLNFDIFKMGHLFHYAISERSLINTKKSFKAYLKQQNNL